jgi:hypothetical protein
MAGAVMRSIDDLNTPADLWELRKTVKDSRSRLEILWKLGIAFYRGRQYTYYSTSLKRIQQLPVDDTKPRARTRIVSNQIKPNCNKLVAKLTKVKPAFTATSGNGDPSSIKAARLAESAADYWWVAFDLETKLRQALTWARVAGQGYWLITWDKYSGEPFSYVCHPETGEMLPRDVASHYQQEVANTPGLDPQIAMRTAYLGEIDIRPVSPVNVWLDTSVEQFEDCRYFGVDLHLDPSEVMTRWGVKLEADSVLTDADLGAQTNDLDTAKKTVVVVSCLYIRPCPSMPSGRVVCFTKDKILEDSQGWPFPFKHLPLVKFGATPIPNSPYDSGEVEDAIPLNKELNKTLSQILTHRDLTINPKWRIPRSSMQAFNAQDEAQYYNPVNGAKPELIEHPGLPAYITEILQDINVRIKEAFGLGDVNTNVAGQQGLESGIALDLAQEESDEVIAPIVRANEISLGKALQMCLEFAAQRYTTERLLTITGSNGIPQVIAFKGQQVKGVSIRCEAASSMPSTKSGRMARVMFLKQNGWLQDSDAAKYLDMPDLKGWKRQQMLDADMAEREHLRILQGQPLNDIALQEAQGQLQSGVNPQTGQPFTDQAEIQNFLLQAMLQPTDFENWQSHYNYHTDYMKSVEYEALPVQVKHEFEIHVSQTLQKIMDMALASKQREGNVKVGLTAHTVLGPTATANVLQEAGVQNIDPENLRTEAPMESLVIENVTPPAEDTSPAGGTTTKPKPKTGATKSQRRAGGA